MNHKVAKLTTPGKALHFHASDQGILVVTLVEGQDLVTRKQNDYTPPSVRTYRPYVTFCLGKRQFNNSYPFSTMSFKDVHFDAAHTSVQKKCNAKRKRQPVWHQIFHFHISDLTKPLYAQVYNLKTFRADQFMGDVEIPLIGLVEDETKRMWVTLNNVPSGKLLVELTYHTAHPKRAADTHQQLLVPLE